jgi:hypothetical protein
MTHARRPNRRRVPAIQEAISGELCVATRKVRYLEQRTARLAAAEVAKRPGDPSGRVSAYRCDACGDWHVGHDS